MKKMNLLAVVLLLSITVFAYTPPKVQAAFKKMYPKASDVAWSQDDSYYCANFVINGFTKKVWFNALSQWAMTQTDLDGLDQLSPVVYNAFASGEYADGEVEDVTMVEFPKWQAIIIIEVEKQNVDLKYQLFYTPQGILYRARNVSYLYDILGPGTFL